jgi:hypothetical protein
MQAGPGQDAALRRQVRLTWPCKAEGSQRGANVGSDIDARAYELVTPEEFGRLRSRNYKHHDLIRAIRDMKSMPAGQGVKLRCFGTTREASRKQKAAIQIAAREGVSARTMVRGGWLFIEKVRQR